MAMTWTWWTRAIFMMSLQDVAAFTLYPPVDPSFLASAYNISLNCLQALYVVLHLIRFRP